MHGVTLQVLLVTADGTRNLVSTYHTKLKIGPIDQKETKFDISSVLVMDKMPSIDKIFPTADNLRLFKNATDLIKSNKFPKFYDTDLHIIIGIREAEMINFESTKKLL